MDQISLTMNAKTASEILNDASLTTWHSFDCGLQDDSGPNKISGIANNVVSGSGKVNNGLFFNSATSYFQVCV